MRLMKALSIALLTMNAVTVTSALAEYPEKPVQFIVPFPPGDLEDILTRQIAEGFQEKYGMSTAVVNKPGGGGGPFPGAVEASFAPADGYVVGSFVADVPVIGPEIGIPPLNPFPFEPLGHFLTYPFIVVAKGDAPFSNFEELAAYAKDNPVTLGHFGNGAIPTDAVLALAAQKGFKYKSDAPFDALDCNTLASGDVDVITTTVQQVRPCLDDLTVLFSIGHERISMLPDVPTMGEIEPGLNIGTWNGLFVKTGTPQDVKDKIIAVAKEVVMSAPAQKIAEETGAKVYWKDAEATTKQIAEDRKTVAVIQKLIAK
nr:tripartite tricarboxylate transporter substrate binding protein [uncultured Cohaesibacter sp.]